MALRPLFILGSGTFALETLDIVEAAGGFEPLGFVVNQDRPAQGAQHAGLPVYWVDDLPAVRDACVLSGIVSTRRRAFVEQIVARGYRLVSVVHPSASISKRAQVQAGCVINAGVVISHNSVICENVVVNRGALIGHDDSIAPFCTIGPGSNIAGGVSVGEGAQIGMGAVVREKVTIGTGAVVGAGAVVVKPVPPGAVVMGVPAQIVNTDSRGL